MSRSQDIERAQRRQEANRTPVATAQWDPAFRKLELRRRSEEPAL